MKIFNRVIFSAVSFLLIIALFSCVLILPWMYGGTKSGSDKLVRDELAGSIDCLISGASHGIAGFSTSAIDEKLNCNSYNLSGNMMTMTARYVLLKKEIERNPVKTVILECSYNTFTRDEDAEYAQGDASLLPRLDSFGERLAYIGKYVSFSDWLYIYNDQLKNGMRYWLNLLIGENDSKDVLNKGYRPKEYNDITLSDDEIISRHNEKTVELTYQPEAQELFAEIVKMCQDKGCRVIVAVVPISDSYIWRHSDWDECFLWIQNFCKENELEYYDFNLIKTRNELFSDSVSFYDGTHLNSQGAETFAELFADVITLNDEGKDLSSLFFDDYSEMIASIPYMKKFVANGTK